MARQRATTDGNATQATPRTKLSKADKNRLKLARMLSEIGSCYKDAAMSLRTQDHAGYERSMGLAQSYQGIVDELDKTISEDLTAEGLQAINEM